MAALRAVENRVPIVRAANTGISGVIDADGRLRDTTELFTKAVVVSEIVPNQTDSPTLYARVGDVFSWACLGLSLVLLGWGQLNVR
jgi:apolipoprotein N-acyltransferase